MVADRPRGLLGIEALACRDDDSTQGFGLPRRREEVEGEDLMETVARDISPRAFGFAAAKYLYHGQLAFYHDGLIASGRMVPKRLPLLVAIQNRAPWDVAVYNLQSDQIEAGRMLYQRLLRRLVECSAADWWPGVAPEIMPLQLPSWAINAETNHLESEDF